MPIKPCFIRVVAAFQRTHIQAVLRNFEPMQQGFYRKILGKYNKFLILDSLQGIVLKQTYRKIVIKVVDIYMYT